MVAAGTVYGVGELETALRRAGKGYVLGVSATHQFQSWSAELSVSGTAKEIAQALDASTWQRLSAGEGTKGARFYDWAYLELADLDTGKFYPGSDGLWTRGLLVRRSLADDKLAYFTTWCPAGTGVDKLVQVEGCRWAIEDSFETAKTELGLNHNETRSWHGWHRHVSLVMLAFAMMASIRHHANQPAPQKTPPRLPQTRLSQTQTRRTQVRVTQVRQPSSAGRSRKSAASPPAWPSDASSPPMSSPGRSGAGRTKPSHNAHI